MNTKQLIGLWPKFNNETREIINNAFSTKGKYSGCLFSSLPNKDHKGRAVWIVLISFLAPQRIPISTMIFDTELQKEVEKIENLILSQINRNNLICLLNTGEPSFRWNTWAYQNDKQEMINLFKNYLKKYLKECK